jgi:hypothetical protein
MAKFQKDEPTMTPAAKDKETKALQALTQDLQTKNSQFQQQYDQRKQEVLAPITDMVKKVLDDLREEGNYSMILMNDPGQTPIVSVQFSENLWPPSITPDHVQLVGAVTGPHIPEGQFFETANQTLQLNFPSWLRQDSYTLTLVSAEEPNGLCDLSINALDGECPGGTCNSLGELPSGDGTGGGNFVATFGVNAPPEVVAVVPEANTLNVPEATNVSLTFSEPINAASVSNATVRLLDGGGTPVPANVTVATSGTRVVIDPVAPLALNQLYTVQVTTGVDDFSLPAFPFSSVFRTSTTPTGSKTLPSVSDQANGLAAQSRTGAAVAGAGDLNGDGIKDWLTGAPAYQSSALNARLTAGPVSGGGARRWEHQRIGPHGPGHHLHWDRRATRRRVGRERVRFQRRWPNDTIGAEQVNRTPDNDPGAGCVAGAPCGNGRVYVIFFDPADTTHYPNIANPALPDTVSLSLVGQPGGIPGIVFDGAAFGDQAGFSVAAGGTSTPSAGRDILIGAPGANPGGRTDAGAAYVVFDNPLSGTSR